MSESHVATYVYWTIVDFPFKVQHKLLLKMSIDCV